MSVVAKSRKRRASTAAKPAAPALRAPTADWAGLPCDLMLYIAAMLTLDDYSRLASVDQCTRRRLTDPEQLARYEARLAGRYRCVRFAEPGINSVTWFNCPLVCDFRAWRAFAGDKKVLAQPYERVGGDQTPNPGIFAAIGRLGLSRLDTGLRPRNDMLFAAMVAHLPFPFIKQIIHEVDLTRKDCSMRWVMSGTSVQNARKLIDCVNFLANPDNVAQFLALREPHEYAAILAEPSSLRKQITNNPRYLRAIQCQLHSEHVAALLACLTPGLHDYNILAPSAPCELYVQVASRAVSLNAGGPASIANLVLKTAIGNEREDVVSALLDTTLVNFVPGPALDELVAYARSHEALGARLAADPRVALCVSQ
jgi:hypothetical protein